MTPPNKLIFESIARLNRGSNDWRRVIDWLRVAQAEAIAHLLDAPEPDLISARADARALTSLLEHVDASEDAVRLIEEQENLYGNTAHGGSHTQ
jgi:hypothetical protein